jgi:PIN domain nuclease of toxin-antitoxin system
MVLDSKALLIFLRGESGAALVLNALEKPCFISAVSWGTVLAELPAVSPRALLEDLERVGIEVVCVDSGLAADASKILATGVKLETALAFTLARQRGLKALFAERGSVAPLEWRVKVNAVR